jgi:hypothetical protein
MSIDFSKAPEGATHYGLDKRGDVIWYSGCFGDVLVFADAGYWALSEAHSSFDRLTPIPTFKPFVSVEDALAAAGVLGRSQAEMLKIHRQIKRLEQTTTGSKHDAVNNPSHYASGGVECIAAIKASMSHEAFLGYLKGNVQKYVFRYEKKANPVEDLKKAQWYLARLVKEQEGE